MLRVSPFRSRDKRLVAPAIKSEGEPCKQGETAAQSGCIPESGEGHKKPLSEKTASATKEEKAVWRQSLSRRHRKAFKSWGGAGYGDMRLIDAGLEPEATTPEYIEELKDYLAAIYEALESCPVVTKPVYRGLYGLDPEAAKEAFREGAEVELTSLTSCSRNVSTAERFALGAFKQGDYEGKLASVVIKVVGAASYDLSVVTGQIEENEHVINKGTKFKVVSSRLERTSDRNAPVHYVTLEAVE